MRGWIIPGCLIEVGHSRHGRDCPASRARKRTDVYGGAPASTPNNSTSGGREDITAVLALPRSAEAGRGRGCLEQIMRSASRERS